MLHPQVISEPLNVTDFKSAEDARKQAESRAIELTKSGFIVEITILTDLGWFFIRNMIVKKISR